MSEPNQGKPDPTADFLKLWRESAARIIQAAGTFTPETMPPEMLRQIRSGIFQALASSWEEFLRSPQFLEGTKQIMDSAIAFRRMSAEFLIKAREEMQAPSRQDVDDVLLALREMEARLNRRVDDVAAQVAGKATKEVHQVVSASRRPRRPASRRVRSNTK